MKLFRNATKQNAALIAAFFLFLLFGTIFPAAEPSREVLDISEYAIYEGWTFIIDGNYIDSDVMPLRHNGHLFLPLRAVAENLGYRVHWDDRRKLASFTQGFTKGAHIDILANEISWTSDYGGGMFGQWENMFVIKNDRILISHLWIYMIFNGGITSYQVQPGDTIFSIIQKFYDEPSPSLIELFTIISHMSDPDSLALMIGSYISIPQQGAFSLIYDEEEKVVEITTQLQSELAVRPPVRDGSMTMPPILPRVREEAQPPRRVETERFLINGVQLETDIMPLFYDGEPFVPLITVAENIGYNVHWNDEETIATLTRDGRHNVYLDVSEERLEIWHPRGERIFFLFDNLFIIRNDTVLMNREWLYRIFQYELTRHTVQEGDTLHSILMYFYGEATIEMLESISIVNRTHGLEYNFALSVGQLLTIPNIEAFSLTYDEESRTVEITTN